MLLFVLFQVITLSTYNGAPKFSLHVCFFQRQILRQEIPTEQNQITGKRLTFYRLVVPSVFVFIGNINTQIWIPDFRGLFDR